MFGIDAPELLVIAAVALIFIGPKELPAMLRSIGRWVATARTMAGEFRGHVDDMVRQADLDDLKKQVEAGAKDAVLDLQALDPTREIKSAIEEGASDARKELNAAQAALDVPPADAPPPLELGSIEPATASLQDGSALYPTGTPESPVEPAFAAVPPAAEIEPVQLGTAAGSTAETPPGTDSPLPLAANAPAPPPQKVAVG